VLLEARAKDAQRQRHVLHHREVRQQMEELEDEADLAATQRGESLLIRIAEPFAEQ